MAYNDLVTDVASFTTQASAASSDLAGVVAGADVLATQFDSLKSTVDSLSIALNELTGGQYTVLKDTAAARPATPSTGQLFFASDTKALSLSGGSWGVVSPTGIVSPFAGATAPEGWLLCDGSAVSQTTYAVLYAVVGANAFGTDSGGNFSLPNLKGRTVIGVGVGSEITATRGTYQGAATLPAHTHPFSGSTGNPNSGGISAAPATVGGTFAFLCDYAATGPPNYDSNQVEHTHNFSGTTSSTGTGTHGVVQPSLPLNYIIKF